MDIDLNLLKNATGKMAEVKLLLEQMKNAKGTIDILIKQLGDIQTIYSKITS